MYFVKKSCRALIEVEDQMRSAKIAARLFARSRFLSRKTGSKWKRVVFLPPDLPDIVMTVGKTTMSPEDGETLIDEIDRGLIHTLDERTGPQYPLYQGPRYVGSSYLVRHVLPQVRLGERTFVDKESGRLCTSAKMLVLRKLEKRGISVTLKVPPPSSLPPGWGEGVSDWAKDSKW